MGSNSSLEASLLLASRFENIEVAERVLLDLCRRAGCGGDSEYWLSTALREAMANAIRHGNRQDPSKTVRVECRVQGSVVTIRVEDQGDGFDEQDVPDPTDPANLLRPNGRGIFYMRQFMDRVDFGRSANGGAAVVMVRDLEATDDD
jgi:serine/threonine-protein kinase RsbW